MPVLDLRCGSATTAARPRQPLTVGRVVRPLVVNFLQGAWPRPAAGPDPGARAAL